MSQPVRVLVADAAPTRFGVRLALDGHMDICAEADTSPLAVQAARSLRPRICLIGHSLAGGGIAAIREIARSVPDTSVIMLSDEDDPDRLLRAVRAGAVGVVPHGSGADQLRRVIGAVVNHEVAVPRAMVHCLVDALRQLEREAEERVTLREREILAALCRGDTTGEIARALVISPVTVRRHISKLVEKAGVRDREELVSWSTQSVAQRQARRSAQ